MVPRKKLRPEASISRASVLHPILIANENSLALADV